MLRLPREWVMVAGLLAAVPSVTLAGPFDFLKPQAKPVVAAQSGQTNQQIANQVAASLKQAQLKGFDINIEVKQGVAKLTGKISDPQQKALATRAASQVEGVQSVDNQLELVAAPQQAPVQQVSHPGAAAQPQRTAQRAGRSNQQVAQQIADSLVSAGLGQHDIEVRFKGGVCSLSGALDTPQQAMSAYQLTASVPEVRQIKNRLTVGGREFNPQAVRPAAYNPQQGPQTAGYPPMPPRGAHPPVQQMAGYPGPQPGPQPGGPVQQAGFPGHGPHFGGPLGAHEMYNSPNLPEYAWPSQAAYDNYGAVSYPSQYDASAWPYIGPFYPYPQVPLGWRSAQLSWDDGSWNLEFNSRTDKWWWFLNPENWD